jgi:ribosomal protein L24E
LYNVILDLLSTKWSWNTSFTDHSIPCTLRCTMILWHMGPRQSLSEVVGTHVVLACNWIITVFYIQYRYPPPTPTPINVVWTKTYQTQREMGHNIEQGAGGIVVCWNSKVLWHLSQDFWNWLSERQWKAYLITECFRISVLRKSYSISYNIFTELHWHI